MFKGEWGGGWGEDQDPGESEERKMTGLARFDHLRLLSVPPAAPIFLLMTIQRRGSQAPEKAIPEFRGYTHISKGQREGSPVSPCQ